MTSTGTGRRPRGVAAALVLSAAVGPAASGTAPVPPRPNIVVILADDLGYGDSEPNGAVGIPTPHVNRLAAEGMRFTQFYVGQAVCSASRAARHRPGELEGPRAGAAADRRQSDDS